MNAPAKREEGGRPYFEPGHYPDMPNDVYHGSLGYSSSTLKVLMEKTYNHLTYHQAHPKEQTKPMKKGDALHTLTFEPHLFEKNFGVTPSDVKKPSITQLNAKKNSDSSALQISKWRDWMEKLGDRTEITQEECDHAERMAKKVREHPQAGLFVENNFCEQSIFYWYNPEDWDPKTGYDYRIKCKVRPDNGVYGHSVVFDLKSTRDAAYSAFMKQIKSLGYHFSGAMYLDGCNRCKEFKDFAQVDRFDKFVWICVENEPPHEVACYEMDSYAYEEGLQLYHTAVRRLYEYKKSAWKGYGEFNGQEFVPQTRLTDIPRWGNKIV